MAGIGVRLATSGQSPRIMCRSEWHTPHASTRTSTSSACGSAPRASSPPRPLSHSLYLPPPPPPHHFLRLRLELRRIFHHQRLAELMYPRRSHSWILVIVSVWKFLA